MHEIYLEQVPEHYDGDYPSVTITHKPSQKDAAVNLESYIADILTQLDRELDDIPRRR